MIAYIEGPLVYKSATYVVVDAHGVGYHINISLYTYEKLVNLERAKVLTYLVIREDAHTLYGFIDEDERSLFGHLISVSGIGPNTARMILSALSPEDLKRTIIKGDISLLKAVKGIGPKSAQRLVVELQDVLKKTSTEDFINSPNTSRISDEALAALTTLGFPRPLAEKAIARILRDNKDISVEELIKQALKMI